MISYRELCLRVLQAMSQKVHADDSKYIAFNVLSPIRDSTVQHVRQRQDQYLHTI